MEANSLLGRIGIHICICGLAAIATAENVIMSPPFLHRRTAEPHYIPPWTGPSKPYSWRRGRLIDHHRRSNNSDVISQQTSMKDTVYMYWSPSFME